MYVQQYLFLQQQQKAQHRLEGIGEIFWVPIMNNFQSLR